MWRDPLRELMNSLYTKYNKGITSKITKIDLFDYC